MTARKRKARRRGTITKMKAGTFQARFGLAADKVSGHRPSHAKTFDTKAEAEQWLSEELSRHDRGEVVGRGSKQTLAEFLRDFYTNVRKSTRGDGVLSAATCAADLELLELYVLRKAPALAATPLTALTLPPIRQLFATLGASGLARATVSRVHRALRARLAYAVAEGLTRFNPMEAGRIPITGKHKRQRVILQAQHAAALFAVCHESRIGAFVAALLWLGCRPGEAAALKWEDCDLDAGVIHIRRALIRLKPTPQQRGTGDNWMLSTTKTGTERKVPAAAVLVAMLRRHRAQQATDRLAAGNEYQNHDLVFAGTWGKPYQLDSMTVDYLKPLLRRSALHLAGVEPLPLPPATRAQPFKDALAARRAQEDAAIAKTGFPVGLSWYGFRHSFATRLASDGVSVKDIQDLLGHSNATTTLNSYIHSSPETHQRALGKLEDAFLPKGKLGVA